jgi:hypothetical protein
LSHHCQPKLIKPIRHHFQSNNYNVKYRRTFSPIEYYIAVIKAMNKIEGYLNHPFTIVPSAVAFSKGRHHQLRWQKISNFSRNFTKYCDQLIPTVLALTEYSSIKSQPIIQAKKAHLKWYKHRIGTS